MSARIRSRSRAARPLQTDRGQPSSGLRFYGDEFVFDAVSGMFFRLSPTGALLLRALESGTKLGALPGLLQSRYGVDRATAARDVELFLNELAALEPLGRYAEDKSHAA